MALTEVQLAKLREHVTAADPIGYYTQIAEWGDPYGVPALGVARGDTPIHDQ